MDSAVPIMSITRPRGRATAARAGARIPRSAAAGAGRAARLGRAAAGAGLAVRLGRAVAGAGLTARLGRLAAGVVLVGQFGLSVPSGAASAVAPTAAAALPASH